MRREHRWYDNFAKVVNFEDGRYKIPPTMEGIHAPLPDNYWLSVDRFHGLLHQFKQDSIIFK